MTSKRNKGIALFVSLALFLLLSIGVIVVLLSAYNYTNITENQIKRLKALSLAESGINYAYYRIRIGEGASIDFPSGSVTDPIGLSSGDHRVKRGGAWSVNAQYCRSANRNINDPDKRYNALGLRLARSMP